MSSNSHPWYLNVMSRARRGPVAASLRAALAMAEPFYAAAVKLRNRGFDRRGPSGRLPRPVISVGNITAGGTGKTPVVRWLAERLRGQGRTVAILSRGYKAAPGSLGDEQRMLDRLLNRDAPDSRGGHPVFLHADPDRLAAGERALREHPEIDVFLLDDGFQHRRLARDLDLVLVRATEPFGFGHVLPRGLLREPMSGLRRAGAFVLTHADGVSPDERDQIIGQLRQYNPAAPIFSEVHAPVAVRAGGSAEGIDQELPLERLSTVRAFAFCGIADPASFEKELRARCGAVVGHRWFADHYDYVPADVRALSVAARAAGADVFITTEKDWARLADLPHLELEIPIWRLDVSACFGAGDEQGLLERVERAIDAFGGK